MARFKPGDGKEGGHLKLSRVKNRESEEDAQNTQVAAGGTRLTSVGHDHK